MKGPILITLEVKKFKCIECEYFRVSTDENKIWQLGFAPTECFHPNWSMGPFPGRSLGRSDDTPHWCPFLKGL